MKILNFGSLNIDHVYKVPHFVKKGETLSSEDLKQYPGGKGRTSLSPLQKPACQSGMPESSELMDNLTF
ncbi:MAG: hypothetical protein V8S14_06470 [Lachnospiraceae bacterium]